MIKTTTSCYNAISKATGVSGKTLRLASDGYAYKKDNGSILAPGDVVLQWCNTHQKGPHILLCGGYDSKGRATFYAHNAAMNNQPYRLSVNTAYEHTLDCDMGAKVLHLSSGGTTTPEPVEVKFLSTTDPNYTSKYFVTETNACPVILCKKTAGSHVSIAGIRIYQENNLVDEFKMNVTNVSDSLDQFHIWFDLNKECGITLQPGTTYNYRFFVTVNGKEYTSASLYFTTKGTSIKPVSVLLGDAGENLSRPPHTGAGRLHLHRLVYRHFLQRPAGFRRRCGACHAPIFPLCPLGENPCCRLHRYPPCVCGRERNRCEGI